MERLQCRLSMVEYSETNCQRKWLSDHLWYFAPLARILFFNGFSGKRPDNTGCWIGEPKIQLHERIAQEHRLPLVSCIKRQALYSYRYNLNYPDTQGSKSKQKRGALLKSWQLEGSRRTAEASVSSGFFDLVFGRKRGKTIKKKKRRIKTERMLWMTMTFCSVCIN